MTRSRVTIDVTGFSVEGNSPPTFDQVADAAYDIASDIGMRLSSLGASALHGAVLLKVGDIEAYSDDDPTPYEETMGDHPEAQ